MSDQTNGLRFDVYERVHLPDDVAAIDELEEIELVPRIQVIDQGDHAVLKGQLLLSGVYRGQNDSDVPLTLEHWIPVEITLPMNRINRLDDISIEIDNFDVDLLSARTLNITGVLSLRGISVEPIEYQEEAWREEPFTVIHQREAADERPAEELNRQTEADQQAYISEESFYAAQVEGEEEAIVTISSSSSDSGWSSAQLFTPSVQQPDILQAETADSQQTSEDDWLASSSQYVDEVYSEPERSQLEQLEQAAEQDREAFFSGEEEAALAELERELDPALEQEPLPEPEKQELRIAFTGKQPDATNGQPSDVGILTLLQTSRREQAARQAAEEVVAQQIAAEEARVQASGDEIEWKKLFLGKQSEDREFRKIRVCIVQRDETLELIASRYSLNSREILVYNRLDDSVLSEGQLLYIP